MSRYYIETWGCQMNELDTQRMSGQLEQQGMERVEDPEHADLILLNSCSIREKAEQKAYSRLGQYRLLKQDNRDLRIGFTGCVAQQEGEEALRRVHDLDFVLGTGRVGELGRVAEQSRRTGERIVATGFPDDRHYDMDSISREGSHKGMVTIIEGCNKRCTFCIVPTTRGPERSRTMAEILAEVHDLVAQGFLEIELLGQTVNHWTEPDNDEIDFADLLDAVAQVPGVERLRFVTSYPRDFSQRMVDMFAKHANLSSYLHLPVQSGSNKVLRRMGRGYQVEAYDRLIESLREARPELALSTDLIVGFPGETDDDFQQTLDLVERTRYASIYAFKYSPRPGTPALRLKDPEVPLDTADRRLQSLFQLQTRIQRELNEGMVGKELDLLVTGWSRQPGYQSGRSSCHRVVHFACGENPAEIGSLVSVRATHANDHSLLGERVA
ncbi:MAG: tRNA (N6-isopentenyl adenosine(37)-C2)-methylthiotransferase MiaB [Acidobacteriota bacterium]